MKVLGRIAFSEMRDARGWLCEEKKSLVAHPITGVITCIDIEHPPSTKRVDIEQQHFQRAHQRVLDGENTKICTWLAWHEMARVMKRRTILFKNQSYSDSTEQNMAAPRGGRWHTCQLTESSHSPLSSQNNKNRSCAGLTPVPAG